MSSTPSFVIQGLAGEKKLRGTIKINGAKNAALKAMAAAVLFDGPVILKNVPDNADVETMTEILKRLGATVAWSREKGEGSREKSAGNDGTITIDSTSIDSTDIDAKLAAGMRASVVLTGPLLGRFNRVNFPAPGGCVIGARPIDLFIEGYKKMGASTEEDKLSYHIETSSGLKGTEIFFNKQTVGGTETLMMAAVLAKGKTILKNCAMEPEIVNVAEWLNSCGAKIKGVGTPTIEISGTNRKLLSAKKPYVAIPDRIEAGSFLILGALCAEELVIEDCEPKHMEAVVNLLKNSGVPMEIGKSNIKIVNNVAPSSLLAPIADLRTHEYPGLATDLQAPVVVFLTQTNGESEVFETIYEGRFKYVEDLKKMGANITMVNPREIVIHGPTVFSASSLGNKGEIMIAEIRAHDIRAGFAVVMAALCGKGEFVVGNVQLIDRGYERLEERLRNLGANIVRK
jgi:UDP-N-acetylglucosamine 1-carboxyvinyltransferase